MTALALEREPERQWAPLIEPSYYERTATLTVGERDVLALLDAHRYRWPAGTLSVLERLIGPVDAVAAVAWPADAGRDPAYRR